MGDFNEVLDPNERKGATSLTEGMRELQSLLFDLQLTDMEIGQKYTWLRSNAASRIDRVLMDQELLLKYPVIRAYCQRRVFSDHFPIVISSTKVNSEPLPFRALDVWLEEPSFLNLFQA